MAKIGPYFDRTAGRVVPARLCYSVQLLRTKVKWGVSGLHADSAKRLSSEQYLAIVKPSFGSRRQARCTEQSQAACCFSSAAAGGKRSASCLRTRGEGTSRQQRCSHQYCS